MIQLTERAAHGLKEILTTNGAPDDEGVKLVAGETGGVGMTIGRPGNGDTVIDADKRCLLIVDSGIAPELDETVIDLAGNGEGEQPQFVIRRDGAADPS